jgi:hypothetical protein
MKMKKRGIRGSKNKGNEENGHSLGTRAGPSLLGGSIVHNVLHAGIFLLDADMKSVLLFRSLVTIQSTQVPTRSFLLQVTSLPTSISYSICLHPDIRN